MGADGRPPSAAALRRYGPLLGVLQRSWWLGFTPLAPLLRRRALAAQLGCWPPRRLRCSRNWWRPLLGWRRVLPSLGVAGPAGAVVQFGSKAGRPLRERLVLCWLRLAASPALHPGRWTLRLPGLGQRLPRRGGQVSEGLWNGPPLTAEAIAALEVPLAPLLAALVAGIHWGDAHFSVSGEKAVFSVTTELRSLPLFWYLRRHLGGGTIHLARKSAEGCRGDGGAFAYQLRSTKALTRLVVALGPFVDYGPKRAQLEEVAVALGVAELLPPPRPLTAEEQGLKAPALFYCDGSATATVDGRNPFVWVSFSLSLTQAHSAAPELLQKTFGGTIYRVPLGAKSSIGRYGRCPKKKGWRWVLRSEKDLRRGLRRYQESRRTLARATGDPSPPDPLQKDARLALLGPLLRLRRQRAYRRRGALRKRWRQLVRRWGAAGPRTPAAAAQTSFGATANPAAAGELCGAAFGRRPGRVLPRLRRLAPLVAALLDAGAVASAGSKGRRGLRLELLFGAHQKASALWLQRRLLQLPGGGAVHLGRNGATASSGWRLTLGHRRLLGPLLLAALPHCRRPLGSGLRALAAALRLRRHQPSASRHCRRLRRRQRHRWALALARCRGYLTLVPTAAGGLAPSLQLPVLPRRGRSAAAEERLLADFGRCSGAGSLRWVSGAKGSGTRWAVVEGPALQRLLRRGAPQPLPPEGRWALLPQAQALAALDPAKPAAAAAWVKFRCIWDPLPSGTPLGGRRRRPALGLGRQADAPEQGTRRWPSSSG